VQNVERTYEIIEQSNKPVEHSAKHMERRSQATFDFRTLVPSMSAVCALLAHLLIPNSPKYTLKPFPYFTIVLTAILAVTLGIAVLSLRVKKVREKYAHKAWFIAAFLLLLNLLNIATLKLMLLQPIYFPSPDRILKVFVDDGLFMLKCLGYSLRLLATGYAIGALAGMTTGILVGWSKKWSYWVNPLIKFIGPIPSTAWVPIALVTFPTSFAASAFLISLAVWFPTTVLTSSGISNVKNSYFEVSSTLGAKVRHKIFKVALPAAMPSIFIGIFNGTSASFITLMTAEMMGVKFGIGWYINWQKDMLSYPNVYAGLIVIALTFSLIVTLLFKVRDRVLGWQKGVIKW
jgi:NitT/TauT family transport system permease protein